MAEVSQELRHDIERIGTTWTRHSVRSASVSAASRSGAGHGAYVRGPGRR